ncbi:MAG: hypothetical protein C0412_16185 [Flavobacterium sp.]|nr:hypothetical protein [Flavobacterium sp.]
MRKYLVILLILFICSVSFSQKVRYQRGYTKSSGKYVQPHFKSQSNKTNWDNYSTKQNSNPYTGKKGSKAKDYSHEAYNYGKQKQVIKGPHGGNYYNSSKNKKIYVPKRY